MAITALRERQEAFCREYLVDLNAAAASVRAGYSAKRANQTGYKLLQHPKIRARVRALQLTRRTRAQLSPDAVVQGLLFEARGFDLNGAPLAGSTAAVRIKAWELLGRHLGMFATKVEHTGKDGGPIDVSLLTPAEREQRLAALFDAARARRDGSAADRADGNLDTAGR